jgi:Predicted nucleotidyltransferase
MLTFQTTGFDHKAIREIDSHYFGAVSGAHFYGIPSPDSDVDLRGDVSSKICKEEFNIAMFRHRESKEGCCSPCTSSPRNWRPT